MDTRQRESTALDRHSPVPLYQQLSDILTKQIKDGVLKPGDHLPSENDLISQYDVSRYVVRQTLNMLGRQGLIFTEHGRGSFVSYQRINKPLDVLQSYHKGMQKSGHQVEVKILRKELALPPHEIAEQLDLAPGEDAFFLERLAFLDGNPINLLISYIAPGRWGKDSLLAFSGGSLYEYLAQECKVHLAHSRSEIEVIFAEEYESRLLNINRGSVLLQISSVVFDKEERPIERTRVIYPGTMFRFQFESFMGDQADDPKRYMLT